MNRLKTYEDLDQFENDAAKRGWTIRYGRGFRTMIATNARGHDVARIFVTVA